MALTQVGTDGIKDDAVTLDKRAGVARGKLIVGDASGNPTALAKGSAGQVLKHDGNDIAWGAVPTAGIAADAIDGTKIADDSIDSEHIVDGSIDNAHLADDAVGTAEIADDAITSALIADDAVVTAAIADDAITSALIADDAVVQAAIADEAVDEARLQISNAGTNGQFLSKQSGNAGGLTWATVDVPKLAAPTLTGTTSVLTSGTTTLTISNYSSDCTYVFASVTNCSIGAVNASGEFVVTNSGSHNSSFTVKATTTSLGLADSDTTAQSLTPKLSAPTISSPADAAINTNVAYTITSTDANDDKLVIDYGASTFTLVSTSHGSASKVGNTVEVTGFTTNNPIVTTTFTAAATYSVKAKSQKADGSYGESAYSSTDSFTALDAYNVSWYAIAGGGGGGNVGGGGGAGGMRSSWNNETSGGGGSAESPILMLAGTTYTMTIGAGGAGNVWPQNGHGGNTTSIAGSNITTISCVGGGLGKHSGAGGGGGCGGGAGYGGGAGTGTANQGYNGGAATSSASGGWPGGGGGGTKSAGTDSGSGQAGNGGYGQDTTISGGTATRGGGGGGGSRGTNSPGAGRDGGGNGATCNCNGGSAGANTGSGGGSAGGNSSTGTSGAGGSGMISIRMPTSNFNSGGVSGAAGTWTVGSDTLITWNSSGTYTA